MAISNVQESYTPAQWDVREKYYIQQIDSLGIPQGCGTSEIKDLAARIDGVRAEASIELAYCSRKFESLERMKKLVEKELFLLLKSQGIAGLKTEAEVGGAVAICIKDIPAQDVLQGKGFKLNLTALQNAMMPVAPSIPAAGSAPTSAATAPATPVPTGSPQVTIIPAIQIAESRMMFMQSIIDIMKDKSSALITIEGALKLENDVSRQGGGNTTTPAGAGNMMA